MCRYVCAVLLILQLSVAHAFGVSLRNEGAVNSQPFNLSYPNTQLPFDLVLQIANDSNVDVNILSWQLELELVASPGSQGQLEFQSVSAPPNSLFGQDPGPQSDLMEPDTAVFVFDVDESFEGKTVPMHSAANILKLTLSADEGTDGSFELRMLPVEDPESDSSWFDADEFAPKLFENDLLLGTISVGSSNPGPGDYNSDTKVDGSDYEQWKRDFGSNVTVAGTGADGNGNGIIDAADYVVWRNAVPSDPEELPTGASSEVPEASTILMVFIGVFGMLSIRSVTTSDWPRRL